MLTFIALSHVLGEDLRNCQGALDRKGVTLRATILVISAKIR